MNEKAFAGGTFGTLVSGAGIAISPNEIAMWISIACTIAGLIITLISSIVIPLINKSLTKENLEEVKKELEKTKDELNKYKDN